MILSERELELGADHAGIMVLPEAEPGTPLADVLPLVDSILDVEPTGNRVDLLSVYGVAREVAALFGLELAPPPGRRPGAARRPRASTSASTTSTAARATSAARSRDVRIGPVAAVAAGPAHGRRDAPDLERRRRHELRHARARQPAPRLRPHARSPATGSSSAARRAARSSGRSTAPSASSTSATS